ncbi:MAG: nuclear transport factor 2 family protein [Ruminococcus sp.]|nr:nuclear transport factor 2 family protein [Ruminococcus sp.]
MDEKDTIRSLYRRYWQYMIDKDTDSLRELMSDNYILMHMTGVRQSKETFLSGLTNGTFNYYSAEHDSIEVTVSGDTARMIGKSRVTAAVYGGRKSTWKLRGDFTLRKESGVWRMTGSEASTY